MAVLYRAVHATQELKRQSFIRDLLDMGVTQYKGKPVRDLDYYEARHALVMARLKKEGL